MARQGYTNEAGEQAAMSAPLMQRIKRGIDLYAEYGENIEWVQEDRCKVPSSARKHPEHFYLVVFGEDGERCNCPDFSRNDIGVCKHTIAALISWARQVKYRVVKRHDSRIGGNIYEVIETRAGVDRVVGWSAYVGTAYDMKWAIEGVDVGEAA